MSGYFIHRLGRLFSILMGWRRTYRPGDLTARILIEYDQALAGAEQTVPQAAIATGRGFRSTARIRIEMHTPRISIQGNRIALCPLPKSLTANSAIRQRVAGDQTKAVKSVSRRVVWLERSAKRTPAACIADSQKERSNVVALHRLAPAVKGSVSKAA